jgi:hypothetical protein
MIKTISAVLLSALLFVFPLGCGEQGQVTSEHPTAEEAATEEAPEHPTAEEATAEEAPEHPTAEEATTEEAEHPASEHPE